jgi:hypothetical protein
LIHRRPMAYCHRLRDWTVRPIGQWHFSWSVPDLIPLDRNVIPTKVNGESTFHFWTYRESITLTRRRESITFRIAWEWMIETNLLMDRTRATAPPSLDYCGSARTAWTRIYLVPAPSIYHIHLIYWLLFLHIVRWSPSARPPNPIQSINHLPSVSSSITPSPPISQLPFASSINHCQFSSSVSHSPFTCRIIRPDRRALSIWSIDHRSPDSSFYWPSVWSVDRCASTRFLDHPAPANSIRPPDSSISARQVHLSISLSRPRSHNTTDSLYSPFRCPVPLSSADVCNPDNYGD